MVKTCGASAVKTHEKNRLTEVGFRLPVFTNTIISHYSYYFPLLFATLVVQFLS